MTNLKKTVSIAMGITFAATMTATPLANATENPFGMQKLESGYMQVAEGKCGEGKCGKDMKKGSEGKCGESMKKGSEGKCGEGMKKGNEGKCGEDMKKGREGKCGEGKCGGNK